MSDQAGVIRRVELQKMDDHEWRAAVTLINVLDAERMPGESPAGLDEVKRRWLNAPPTLTLYPWLCWNDREEQLLGLALLITMDMENNRHLGQCVLFVAPDARRRGIATRLFRDVVDETERTGRRLLIGDTHSRVPAGEAFARRIGAQHGQDNNMVDLVMDEVDRDLLQRWIAQAQERAGDFDLGVWEGPYPEDRLDEVVAMYEAANQVPRGNLDFGDRSYTPEQLRDTDRAMLARGATRWVVYARHRPSGEIAGYTTLYTEPTAPRRMEVGMTAVFERYQNRGLGRWLKATIIEKVINERPDITRIRTGNAVGNAPMITINEQLGFKLVDVATVWQIDLETARAYLASRQSQIGGQRTAQAPRS